MTPTSSFPIARLPRQRRPFRAVSVLLIGGALALWSSLSVAHEYWAGTLKIEHPWSRATAAGAAVGAGFMTITNSGRADALLAASSPVAERVELHLGRIENRVMQMRRLERIELPAGETVRLEPGGLHLMLIGLKQPLVEGSRVPLVLRFAGSGERKIELQVEALGAQGRGAQSMGTRSTERDHGRQ